MSGFASEEYNSCKTWIAAQIQAGATWEQVKNLCVSPEFIDRELERLKYDELIIPLKMDLNMWRDLVKDIEGSYSPIVEMYGISADGNSNTLPIPTDSGSAWVRYKNSLLGKYTRKPKMSEAAVASIEKNSHWILNHIKRDTRAAGPVKGLVMGSVQSGKTANMIGLVSMAAHYDWNFIIVLSGTIDNLRKQTRDRFFDDLTQSGGVSWHILDRTSNPDYMVKTNYLVIPGQKRSRCRSNRGIIDSPTPLFTPFCRFRYRSRGQIHSHQYPRTSSTNDPFLKWFSYASRMMRIAMSTSPF